MKIKPKGQIKLSIDGQVKYDGPNTIDLGNALELILSGLSNDVANANLDTIKVFDDLDVELIVGVDFNSTFDINAIAPSLIVNAEFTALQNYKLGKLNLANSNSGRFIASKVFSPFVNVGTGQIVSINWIIEINTI